MFIILIRNICGFGDLTRIYVALWPPETIKSMAWMIDIIKSIHKHFQPTRANTKMNSISIRRSVLFRKDKKNQMSNDAQKAKSPRIHKLKWPQESHNLCKNSIAYACVLVHWILSNNYIDFAMNPLSFDTNQIQIRYFFYYKLHRKTLKFIGF